MRTYNPQQPLCFIHVPKTAGTSLRSVFKTWFGENLFLHYEQPTTGNKPSIHKLLPNSCIFGHFHKHQGYGVEQQYPEIQQFVTILRDPFDAMVSRYYYVRKVATDWPVPPPPLTQSLDEFLHSQQPNMMHHLPYQLSMENYQQILSQHFIHIGVTEYLQASTACIARKLDQPNPVTIPTENHNHRPRQFTPQLRIDFKQKNPLAYAIYDFALENHNKLT